VTPTGPCIFCRIIADESPADFVFRDDSVVAIADLRRSPRGMSW
jgi:diadenosine tetraphosphate (Ap4A) HIT family hydrolase